jgi:hypothetical protein
VAFAEARLEEDRCRLEEILRFFAISTTKATEMPCSSARYPHCSACALSSTSIRRPRRRPCGCPAYRRLPCQGDGARERPAGGGRDRRGAGGRAPVPHSRLGEGRQDSDRSRPGEAGAQPDEESKLGRDCLAGRDPKRGPGGRGKFRAEHDRARSMSERDPSRSSSGRDVLNGSWQTFPSAAVRFRTLRPRCAPPH